VVTTVALVWLTAEIVNLVWPRAVFGDWYLNWGILIMTGALGVVGGLIAWRVFPPRSRPAASAAAGQAEPARLAEPGAAAEGGQ
jgi:hypothetical protein